MDVNVSSSPTPYSTGVIALLRLVYTELQYWLVGLTPEGYHFAQASAWESFGKFDRAAKHLSALLENKEDPQMRALLAYCYSRAGRWADAAREYTAVAPRWSHPSVVLGLAEAKFRLGDVSGARVLAELVGSEHSPLEPMAAQGLAILRTELAAAPNNSFERTREG
jgi:hypothetical protein